jgi:ATP-binding cassette subfamily B protein
MAGVTVALHADRLAHRRRVVVMAGFFDHVLRLAMSFYGSAHSGQLLKVMIEGASGMFGVWLSFFREHCAALVALIVLLPTTLIVNWRLGGVLLALAVILGFLMNIVLCKTETMQSAADVYSSDLAARVSDVLGNMPAIQSFSRADEEKSALSKLIDRMLDAQMPVLTWWALASVATRSSSTLALVSILVTGVWLLMQRLTTIGQIVAFMSLAQMLIAQSLGRRAAAAVDRPGAPKKPVAGRGRLWRQKRGCYPACWRGAADGFLVAVTPSKNVAHGLLRT